MPIQNHLSHSLGQKTQEGNKALAQSIASSGNGRQLKDLIQFVESKPQERLQMDAILTLAYIAEQNPEMMKDQVVFLLDKLNNPINRVVFGSMIALAHIVHLFPDKLYQSLPVILDAMAKGTVVTKDYGFRILVSLYKEEKYSYDTFYIILEQLTLAPDNQLGQYTERMIPILQSSHKSKFITTLEERGGSLINEFHLKRLTKHLKKLYK